MPRLKRNYLVCHDRLFLIILGFPPFNWCSSTCFKINLAVLDVRVGLNFSKLFYEGVRNELVARFIVDLFWNVKQGNGTFFVAQTSFQFMQSYIVFYRRASLFCFGCEGWPKFFFE